MGWGGFFAWGGSRDGLGPSLSRLFFVWADYKSFQTTVPQKNAVAKKEMAPHVVSPE